MAHRIAMAFLALFILTLHAGSSPSAQQITDPTTLRMMQPYDPQLLRQAAEMGLYSRIELPIWREMNPYYLRGDFNGDGENDVAVWVVDPSSQSPGIVIIHSTLDTVFVYGAGRPRPPGHSPDMNRVRVDAWHVLHPGYIENSPYGTVPEIGVTEGVPFTFERETLEFGHLGKSAFVFYWAKGQYWEFWTAD